MQDACCQGQKLIRRQHEHKRSEGFKSFSDIALLRGGVIQFAKDIVKGDLEAGTATIFQEQEDLSISSIDVIHSVGSFLLQEG